MTTDNHDPTSGSHLLNSSLFPVFSRVVNPDPKDVKLDSPEQATPVYFRDSPLNVLAKDLRLLLVNAKEIPNIFLPLPKMGTDVAMSGSLIQLLLTTVSIIITMASVASILAGVPSPLVVICVLLGLSYLVNVYDGSSRVMGSTDESNHDFGNESGLLLFGRQVIGIHHRTFGIWFDLIECLLQRDLMWPTTHVRQGLPGSLLPGDLSLHLRQKIVCSAVQDPKKKRIVLMSHAQGGIILSTWVDQLLADFSTEELRKVEIYTFASAANHFSGPTTHHHKSPFARFEHFVNTKDYVSLIGLLAFAPPPPLLTATASVAQSTAGVVPVIEGRYTGRVLARLGAIGHLLLAHYLSRDNSILDDPNVMRHSWLTKYRNGKGGLER